MKIGLVGLGRMGEAIAQRLVETGCQIVAFDRDLDRCKAVKSSTIDIATNARTVAESSDIVISIVSDDDGVRSLFLGSDGFLQTDIAGKLFIEMSTIRPMTSVQLAATVVERRAGLIDAPVLGSVPSVRKGSLLALVGGSTPHVDQSRQVLGRLTRKIMHLGGSGSGNALKLAVNLTMAAYLQSIAEALALGRRYDLSIDTMLEVLSEAPTANPWLASKLNVLKGGSADITLDVQTLRKDVMCAVAAGALAGVPMPGGAGVLSALSAAVAHGWGSRDLGELPRFFREFTLQGEPDEQDRSRDGPLLEVDDGAAR
ncbi:NAD(P)-dependent oxidoreductase [Bradyrhizobium sp. AUGA SZCCT0182]|uniref:NAD(P)-dependent oxidoreductase n=1 Tax=Bradyrhizobium sp. AUGA SZCCT0182 TaxID=2807667 RepID=UPI001BADF377|nr:NAD(P)-dependent oxidoreductase [Bradyrhizobium sp. AUGA SZCCT0182]MBR1235904.1 NAD(P)-dependent oxidoreductase [Bradyrhizobium sp. AUGA SZCCT0182]